MKTYQKARQALICLAVLVTIATIAIAGCTDTTQVQPGEVTAAGNLQSENPAPVTAVTSKAATIAGLSKTAQPASAPISSTGVIKIDPISDKYTGDKFTLTGTTSLPAGTNILFQIMPDTGTPPTGLDKDSMMSVGGNNQVTKGDGTLNRVSLAIDLGRLVPGKYVAIVGKMKGDETTGIVFEIGNDYSYTYFTLK
ncbi:MAG: hypothetical protein LUQ66_10075 [Methanoregula sp.]|nr:hypothetical protein [Methanoregula sp.]